MRFLPVNLNALIVELDNLEQTLSLLDSLNADKIRGVEEIVPAARTILVNFQPETVSAENVVANIRQRNLTARATKEEKLIEVPVHYNGEDLVEVAQILNITPEEVIERHSGSEYTVAFTGFAPGFAYLSGGHPSLDVPRRKTPRTAIPAGAVGLAGTFSGVYPQASPGGWQIIGTTETPMWDLNRETPALLQPGYRVRFVDASTLPASEDKSSVAQEVPVTKKPVDAAASLEIKFAGIQTLFQDKGRLGKAGQGVAASGALDQASLAAANRLLGNTLDTACLEITYGCLDLVCHGEAVIAITGADVPINITKVDGSVVAGKRYQTITLSNGDQLSMDMPSAGIRTYLGVRGGFLIDPILDSCSTDTLAKVGPKPVANDDILPIRPIKEGEAAVVHAEETPPVFPTMEDVVTLDVIIGPRTDWFTPEAIELLRTQVWQVTQESSRVGIRLEGETPLERSNSGELASEGTSVGAIQVPPSGQPVLFLKDRPLTGGYPVIGAVATYHLDLAGQVPINAYIRFNPITEFKEW